MTWHEFSISIFPPFAQKPADVGCEGNLLLDRICGAHISLYPTTSLVTNKQYNAAVDKYAAALRYNSICTAALSTPSSTQVYWGAVYMYLNSYLALQRYCSI